MSSRPNRVLAIAVGVIVLLAVVAGVWSATRSVTEYGRDTPQGAVQGYLEAVIDGDSEKAAGFLAKDSPCTVEDLDRAGIPDSVSAVLRDSVTGTELARVDVDITIGSEGPFAGSAFTEKHVFRLTRSGDTWMIRGSPWPMFECFEEE